jgi:hypothetical protein
MDGNPASCASSSRKSSALISRLLCLHLAQHRQIVLTVKTKGEKGEMTDNWIQQLSNFRLMREYSRRLRDYLRMRTNEFYTSSGASAWKSRTDVPFRTELLRRGLRHVAHYLQTLENSREGWSIVNDNAKLIQDDIAAKMNAWMQEEASKRERENPTPLRPDWWHAPDR